MFEECTVQRIFSRNNRIRAVESTKGAVECDYFVNCGGIWARKIGRLSEPEVKVPVHPVEHYYLITKPIDGLDANTPGSGVTFLFRWMGGCCYCGGGGILRSSRLMKSRFLLVCVVVRDQDGYIYFREQNGCLLAGGYEPVAKPLFDDGKVRGL